MTVVHKRHVFALLLGLSATIKAENNPKVWIE